VNTAPEAAECAAAARAVAGAELVDFDSLPPSLGAEDFGYILERTPGECLWPPVLCYTVRYCMVVYCTVRYCMVADFVSLPPSLGSEDFGYILERTPGECLWPPVLCCTVQFCTVLYGSAIRHPPPSLGAEDSGYILERTPGECPLLRPVLCCAFLC